MGGFAGSHHNTVLRLEERGLAKLICTCDPNAAFFAPQQQILKFQQRGVGVFDNLKSMLSVCHSELDMLVIPTPIHLHAQMHAEAAALGIPCYLEKPPTLDYEELERMIGNDAKARKLSLVGFNFIVEKSRLALKERILAGEFGAIRGATLSAFWPRPASYFKRNDWAGRLMIGDQLVMDSCFGNAMAHFVHNMLFWTGGPSLFSWASIAAVRAELYRAHGIEGADTFFVEADTAQAGTLRIALTHACAGASSHSETVLCDKAVLRYSVGGQIEISWSDGRSERIALDPFDGLSENHLEYYRYLRGEATRPATSLADSRPFVALNDLAYLSSGSITRIPDSMIQAFRDEKEQKDYINVVGLPKVIEMFLSKGLWPGANGWGRDRGEVVTLADLPRLRTCIEAMAKPAK